MPISNEYLVPRRLSGLTAVQAHFVDGTGPAARMDSWAGKPNTGWRGPTMLGFSLAKDPEGFLSPSVLPAAPLQVGFEERKRAMRYPRLADRLVAGRSAIADG